MQAKLYACRDCNNIEATLMNSYPSISLNDGELSTGKHLLLFKGYDVMNVLRILDQE
jgi:hypothetical protein